MSEERRAAMIDHAMRSGRNRMRRDNIYQADVFGQWRRIDSHHPHAAHHRIAPAIAMVTAELGIRTLSGLLLVTSHCPAKLPLALPTHFPSLLHFYEVNGDS